MLQPISAIALGIAAGFAILVPFGGLQHRAQPVSHQTEAGYCNVLDPEAPDYLASVECDIMGCKVKRAR